MQTKKKNGFTIIELLVVVSIIALISSVILSILSDAKRKGRDTSGVQSLQEVVKALQVFTTDKGYYPPTAEFPRALIDGKYILATNPKLVYKAMLYNNTAECPTTGMTNCYSYHLGIPLEGAAVDNKVLVGDKDSSNLFPGNSSDCSTTGSTPDKCYDVEP